MQSGHIRNSPYCILSVPVNDLYRNTLTVFTTEPVPMFLMRFHPSDNKLEHPVDSVRYIISKCTHTRARAHTHAHAVNHSHTHTQTHIMDN